MDFPKLLSFTVTNACNLRCRMCGQWSETGYVRLSGKTKPAMQIADWKRLVDEAADNGVAWLLIRGGEPFAVPGVIELLDHLHEKRISFSIDTNATMFGRYAKDLVRIGDLSMTVSVDGTEEIHDYVRGVKGAFQKIEENLAALRAEEKAAGKTLPLSICFTISPYSLPGLGDMPEVARRLGVPELLIVPYYYYPAAVGKKYEEELSALGSRGRTWRGFHHETSGVDIEEFLRQLRRFKETLGSIKVFPFMDLTEDDYRTWFTDATTPVGSTECWSVEKVLDIQPDGEANFCVDTPDYSIGNVLGSTIRELWNGEPAERFRKARRKAPLAVCHRCGAKYMAAPRA
jgi:MoaA/NifB/PqqE/SkfB family radical SAM enzyme